MTMEAGGGAGGTERKCAGGENISIEWETTLLQILPANNRKCCYASDCLCLKIDRSVRLTTPLRVVVSLINY